MQNLHAPTEVTSMVYLNTRLMHKMHKQIPGSSLSKITGVFLENAGYFNVNKDCTVDGNHLILLYCVLFHMTMEVQRM